MPTSIENRNNQSRRRAMSSPGRALEGWQLEGDSAEAYEQYLAAAFKPWAEDLIRLAGLKEGERVLDLACGTGIVARQAAPKVGARGKVVGLDVNEGMLRVARAVSAGVRPPIEWRQGNAGELPFPVGTFDVAFCEQAMQFFSDPVAALGEMRRVLAPGARVAVSVCRPIRYSPAYVAMADALARHVGPEAGAMMRSPFCSWTVDQFRGLFTEAGFRDVRVTIEVGALRYPSVEEFLRREAASSPLAGPIGALSASARNDLVRDLEAKLSDRVDDDGVMCAIETYVALAHEPTLSNAKRAE
jgi:ubiquinone/menaquinone biosynthesis C-methylase UbiE